VITILVTILSAASTLEAGLADQLQAGLCLPTCREARLRPAPTQQQFPRRFAKAGGNSWTAEANLLFAAQTVVGQANVQPATRPKLPPEKKARARALATALVYGFLLLLTFLILWLAIMRFTRRYRAYLAQSKSKPTPVEDVWLMHKLPPEALEDEEGPREEER